MTRKIVCGVGVGISFKGDEELVFLLEHKSPTFQNEVLAWARGRAVEVRFVIAGKVQQPTEIDV